MASEATRQLLQADSLANGLAFLQDFATRELNAEALRGHLMALWQQALEIWISGGWAMVAIAVISLVMFALGMHVYLSLSGKGFARVREKTWRHWINHPEERRGAIGELLNFVTGGASLREIASSFEELRSTEVSPFDRDLGVMKICVGAAPLLGLLGTVTGMLATFKALASGAGGEKTMEMIARGRFAFDREGR
ncbi:MAG TPA: MotA/TolQ/ExbB proton channel family protein, partial [bacterium]|nr:MotA/TolQ/ExbB proton channel family protein [bacterium]